MEEIIYKIYQRIGDCLTGSKRKRKFYKFVAIIFFVLIVVSIYYEIKIPQETLYWVFSSIVQSLLALVALIGVVMIFKLQTIKNREEIILRDETLRRDIEYFEGRISPIESPSELINIINKAVGKSSILSHLPEKRRLQETKSKLNKFTREKTFLRKFMLKFGIYTLTVVMLTLIFLAIAHIIYQYNLSLPTLYLTIILTAYSLFLTIKGMSETLF